MANLKHKQNVYDLGCGDGFILIKAAKEYKCNFIGIEKKLDVFLIAKLKTYFFSNIKIKKKDMFDEDISKADVVFSYLLPGVIKELEIKIKNECKRGTLIISNSFKFKNLNEVEQKKIGKNIIRKYIL